jgi:ADP-dependent NAD(P)H-hydrate dehydratase / NAD(P)H-hydrate epimerase
VIPVVTPEEMAAIDAAAPDPVEVLIERAGAAVARHAIDLMGGAYGRHVVIVEGKGNNGNDGRSAARRLRARGVKVTELGAADAPATLPACDLVVDAAYGTGLRTAYDAPVVPPGAHVLAVDIPSGVDGLTGALRGRPMAAHRTITFAALKPGLLLEPGAHRCGDVRVADIGLDVTRARAHVVEGSDVARWLPARAVDTHKWRSAVWVVAGSPGMAGAAHLASAAAMRAGSGYVRLSTPGGGDDPAAPTEVVRVPIGRDLALDERDVKRFGAMLIGPGLGRDDDIAAAVRRLVASVDAPVVVDGDGLTALGAQAADVLRGRSHATILSPHEGEFAALGGTDPTVDRFAAVRELAARLGVIVLLKGPTTLVASPAGEVLASMRGDQRLATAGTGDVLAGTLAALVASGVAAFEAAAAAAFLHGTAALLAPRDGMVASDLLALLPRAIARVREA